MHTHALKTYIVLASQGSQHDYVNTDYQCLARKIRQNYYTAFIDRKNRGLSCQLRKKQIPESRILVHLSLDPAPWKGESKLIFSAAH